MKSSVSFLIVVLAVVLVSFEGAMAGSIVGWWKFEGNANDSSGNNRHGTLYGSPGFATGIFGEAVVLDGFDDYVNIDGYKGVLGTHAFTITAWIITAATSTSSIVNWGSGGGGARMELVVRSSRLRCEHGNGNIQGDTYVGDIEWHHVAAVVKENATISYPDVIIYLDGRDDTRSSTDSDKFNIVADKDVSIGRRSTNNDRYFEGRIDDVRIYDYELSWAEIRILNGNFRPLLDSPADEALVMATSTWLKWTPGVYAANVDGHEVYLGDNCEDVNTGTGTLLATLSGSSDEYLATGLDDGRVYYWKVDAVNDLHLDKRWSSGIWSFTVPAFKAWNPSPYFGETNVDPDATLSWSPGIYATSHDVYLGMYFDEVHNATDPDTLPGRGNQESTSYDPGGLDLGRTYYWRIDEVLDPCDPCAPSVTGDVWAFTTGVTEETITKPGRPSGQTNPVVDLIYPYTTTGATSSLGHDVEYQFYWGDGTTSGWSTSKSANHKWGSTGKRAITVTARCKIHTDKLNTSVPLEVTVVVPPVVTVCGTVYDKATDQPLADANVEAEGKQTQTDVDGTYEISGLSPGDITVTANKTGYQPTTEDLTSTQAGQIYDLDFYLEPELELIGIEVIQTIQDWECNVPLIAGKTTWVHAYVQPKKLPSVTIPKAYLHASREDIELLPYNPLKVSEFTATPYEDWHRTGRVKRLNFKLPPQWCEEGTLTLRLSLLDCVLDCQQAAATDDNCTLQVDFESTAIPQVVLQKISGPGTQPNTSEELIALGRRLIDIYPIAALDLRIRGPLYKNIPDSWNTMLELQLHAHIDCLKTGECKWLFYGVVNAHVDGKSYLCTRAAAGPKQLDVLAHELAHLLCRPDAVNRSISCSWGSICGPCTESMLSIQDPEDFPHIFVVNDNDVATIGPMDLGENRLIYGLDANTLEPFSPDSRFELMSYCPNPPGNISRWISDHTYKRIKDAINGSFGVTSQLEQASFLNSSAQDYLLVWGRVYFETDTVSLMPFTFISNPVALPPEPNTGDYTLVLLDDSNSTISEISFEPGVSADGQLGIFIIPVPADPNIKRAVVVHDVNTIGSATASDNSPSVQVLSPNGGETLDEGKLLIEWTASDQDGDQLTYFIDYSSDGGNIWQTLAVNWSDSHYEISHESLNATNQGLIRVQASDGFNTASDESDGVFTVQNNAPVVLMFQPKGNAVFYANRLIFFEASALDREDGQLSGASLQWTSSTDGLLGEGKVLTQDANTLSQGYHQITVTATDSNGLTDTASVNIWVAQIPADFSMNGTVNFIDYAVLANQWRQPPAFPSADIAPPPTGDGIVNFLDLALMAEHWLEGTSP